MIITLLAVLLAALTAFYFNHTPITLPLTGMAVLAAVGGSLQFLLAILLNSLILFPLEQLEQKLIPNLMELFRRDTSLRIGRVLLFLFPLMSYFIAFLLLIPEMPYKPWIFLFWIIAFGVGLDLLKNSWRSMLHFLNPFYLVNQFTHEAKRAIQNEKDDELWKSIDNVSEVALRALEKSKIALSTQTLQAFPPIIHAFFASSKSISRINIDKKVEKETGRDEASYTIFYLLQRLELINDRALQLRIETVCRQMVMVMGKIIVYSAKYDLSMVSFPTHFLSKFGLKAQQHHFGEVADLTTSTLLEIARTILTEIDITYAELQEPFQAIINGLDAIAKATFKKDKNTSFQVLTHPFHDLKALFQTEKMARHPDTPVILQEIDRVLSEFEALEQVVRAIPAIPDIEDAGSLPPLPPDTFNPGPVG
ncbi:hypothetical protein [Candidatus Protochlamydia phocaeensis]|uniref:hypothetical protein n=1 Tax=Candidatus Protochlamydia phocaeensis TaxID=1414722 RepID=UPI0008391DD0|nr:hypothetical protein [Candidatus Protochlamydia phocaeensis]